MAYLDHHLDVGPTASNTIAFIAPEQGAPRNEAAATQRAASTAQVSAQILTPAFAPDGLRELEIAHDPTHAALWCYMRPSGPPSFTPSLLGELLSLRTALSDRPEIHGLRYFIGASRLPGIFNLGGDLSYFVETIRASDRERLRAYAFDCCKVAYQMATSFDTPAVTIALVQGDALGGGFEGALAFQVLVAEKSARMGLPEVLFNLFPGMGAYSLLARKIGAAQAERMILSGKVYTASELHELGVVDVLADDGEGEAEVKRFIAGGAARYRLHHAMTRVARRYAPVTLQELCDITDIWVDTAMQLDDTDLRKMERLALAQRRRLGRQ